MKRPLLIGIVLLCAWIAEPFVSSASAQDSSVSSDKPSTKSKRAKRAKRGKRARAEEPKPAETNPATAKAEKGEAAVPLPEGTAGVDKAGADKAGADKAAGDKATAAAPAFGAEEQVRKEGGTEVKTVEFTGLDIEGQLKTPQLLYFLTRLRAEFDRPRLPHRSFMPELQRTPGEKSLR